MCSIEPLSLPCPVHPNMSRSVSAWMPGEGLCSFPDSVCLLQNPFKLSGVHFKPWCPNPKQGIDYKRTARRGRDWLSTSWTEHSTYKVWANPAMAPCTARNNDNCEKSYSSSLLGVTMQHLALDPEATAIWFQPLWRGIKRACHGLFFLYQKHFPASLLLSLQQASVLSEASFHLLSFCVRRNLTSGWSQLNISHFPSFFFSFLLRRMRSGSGAECVFRPPPPAWWGFHYDSVKYNGYFA